LKYGEINKFKITLKEKITSTLIASQQPGYSPFLKHFVQYKPKLEEREISGQEYIISAIRDLSKQVAELRHLSAAIPSGIGVSRLQTGQTGMMLLELFRRFSSSNPTIIENAADQMEVFKAFQNFLKEYVPEREVSASEIMQVVTRVLATPEYGGK
jgi:hypothetical protein